MPSSTVSVFCVSLAVSSSDAMLLIWKSTLRCQAVSSPAIAASVSAARAMSATCTVMTLR